MTAVSLVPRPLARNGWRAIHLWGAVALGLVAFAATWPAWHNMFEQNSPGRGGRYLWLAPLIAAWLAWVRRKRILMCRPRGHRTGPAILLVGVGLYLTGQVIASHVTWHLGAVLTVMGAVLTMTGRSLLDRYLPVFIALLFIVPVPGPVSEAISLPMQWAAANVTVGVYHLLGIPASCDGTTITVHGITQETRWVCQGFPAVWDLFLVTYAFVFGIPLRETVRAVVLILSPASAALCTMLGLMGTLWMYGSLPTEQADTLRQLSGWVTLSAAFLLLTAVVRLMAWASVPLWQYSLAYDY